MGDVDLVWVRSYSVNGRDVMTLARESEPTRWLTAADVREILGDEVPVIAYDDSGPGGAIIFPADGRRHESGHPLDVMLAEQLRTAIRRAAAVDRPAEPAWAWLRPQAAGWEMARGADAMMAADVLAILGDEPPCVALNARGPGGSVFFPSLGGGYQQALSLRNQINAAIEQGTSAACPAESFPEPGVPDVDADGFDEPAGGESARVAAEEAAHLAALKAAAAAPPAAKSADPNRAAFHGWRSGDRFEVLNRDDAARAAAASYLWPVWWGGLSAGHVITRCDMHLAGHHTVPGLLIDCEGLSRPTVIAAATLSACARKVTA